MDIKKIYESKHYKSLFDEYIKSWKLLHRRRYIRSMKLFKKRIWLWI
jgi:hypothetical protein